MSQLREGTSDPQRLRKNTNEIPSASIRTQEVQKQISSEKIIILAIIFAVLFTIIALLILYNKNIQLVNEGFRSEYVHNNLESNDNEALTTSKSYTNKKYGFSFEYPSDWILTDNSVCEQIDNGYCGSVTVSKNKYIWSLDLDPEVTGGGLGYMFDGLLLPSQTEKFEVIPSEYSNLLMDCKYVPKVSNDIINSTDSEDLNVFYKSVKVNTWDGCVLFSKENVDLEPGFGPGTLNDDVEGNYFSVRYYYDTYDEKEERYNKGLPVKDDIILKEMLNYMNEITNSITVKE